MSSRLLRHLFTAAWCVLSLGEYCHRIQYPEQVTDNKVNRELLCQLGTDY